MFVKQKADNLQTIAPAYQPAEPGWQYNDDAVITDRLKSETTQCLIRKGRFCMMAVSAYGLGPGSYSKGSYYGDYALGG